MTANTKLIIGAVLIVLIGGGAFFFMHRNAVAPSSGSYAYTCADGTKFTMTPKSDMSSIHVVAESGGALAESLDFVSAPAGATDSGQATATAGQAGGGMGGVRFQSGATFFVGAGEGVTITTPDKEITCSPVPNSEEAPWNFGDAGEGGGSVQPDVALVVGESIVGTWKSSDDAKFVREFRSGGVAIDYYDGKQVSYGIWTAFTKEKPVQYTPFTLEANAVYIQMTFNDMKGAPMEGGPLSFKVSKLTPEELELIYMDGVGSALRFSRM